MGGKGLIFFTRQMWRVFKGGAYSAQIGCDEEMSSLNLTVYQLFQNLYENFTATTEASFDRHHLYLLDFSLALPAVPSLNFHVAKDLLIRG